MYNVYIVYNVYNVHCVSFVHCTLCILSHCTAKEDGEQHCSDVPLGLLIGAQYEEVQVKAQYEEGNVRK